MYYLSILAQFKNETMNLKLWLDHHIWQGVQHFYLIDNGSTDRPLLILRDYIRRGIVSYFYRPTAASQVKNYREVFARKIWRRTRWLAVIDADEFLYGVDRRLISKIRSLEYYNLIYCNWFLYGTSGCKEHPQDIRMANIHRQPEIDPLNTKYIVKTSAIRNPNQIWIHWIFKQNTIEPIKRGKKIRIANELVRINHYVCQSEEFFRKVKSVRGDANSTETKWTKEYFDLHNNKATLIDETLKNIVLNPPLNY
jgi:glycosyltransferase involved in cell wall biosynthesis